MPFIDLQAQQERIADKLRARIAAVLEHGAYIMGPEVGELEERLADSCGAKHCVTCSNGTDALLLPLRAKGIGPGDAVFVPSFTFVATAEVVSALGATPLFVDVLPDTFNMGAQSLEAAIAFARTRGLTPRAVIPVDLFGQPADYDSIAAVAQQNGLW
ncbi:MAG TPA: aminotransferase DegT, partial [Rhodospirillaceae bacterium]|nr:aminotransferase DegT [Rhodospirillaceae bacterium]